MTCAPSTGCKGYVAAVVVVVGTSFMWAASITDVPDGTDTSPSRGANVCPISTEWTEILKSLLFKKNPLKLIALRLP